MVGVQLPLSRLPVYFCFAFPSISASLARLYSLTSPSIKPHFPVNSFFASLPRLFCFISPPIVLHFPDYSASFAQKDINILLKMIKKCFHIFQYFYFFFSILLSVFNNNIHYFSFSLKKDMCKEIFKYKKKHFYYSKLKFLQYENVRKMF